MLGTFSVHVDVASSVAAGGQISPDTFLWWLGQSDAARQHALDGQADVRQCSEQERSALASFASFLTTDPDMRVRVWAAPATFDLPIIESAFRRHALTPPWVHATHRCASTLICQVPAEVLPRAPAPRMSRWTTR